MREREGGGGGKVGGENRNQRNASRHSKPWDGDENKQFLMRGEELVTYARTSNQKCKGYGHAVKRGRTASGREDHKGCKGKVVGQGGSACMRVRGRCRIVCGGVTNQRACNCSAPRPARPCPRRKIVQKQPATGTAFFTTTTTPTIT